jgi:hypothetical protein
MLYSMHSAVWGEPWWHVARAVVACGSSRGGMWIEPWWHVERAVVACGASRGGMWREPWLHVARAVVACGVKLAGEERSVDLLPCRDIGCAPRHHGIVTSSGRIDRCNPSSVCSCRNLSSITAWLGVSSSSVAAVSELTRHVSRLQHILVVRESRKRPNILVLRLSDSRKRPNGLSDSRKRPNLLVVRPPYSRKLPNTRECTETTRYGCSSFINAIAGLFRYTDLGMDRYINQIQCSNVTWE